MKRRNKGPDLDKYITDKERRYVRYEEGAKLYGLPYYTFVNLAKAAGANMGVRRKVVVDLDILEEYILANHKG